MCTSDGGVMAIISHGGRKGRSWKVPQAFCGERLAIRPLTADGTFGIFFGTRQVATIDLTGRKSVSDVPGQVSAMSSNARQ